MSMMDDLRLMDDAASLGSTDVVSFDGLDLMLDEQFGHLGYDDSGTSNINANGLANEVNINEIHINGFNMNGVNMNGVNMNGINTNCANANHINASDFVSHPVENSNVLDDMVVETFFPDMLMTHEENQKIQKVEDEDESKTNESCLVPVCDEDYSINMEEMDMDMEEAIMNDSCLDNMMSLAELGPAHPDFIFPEQEEKQDGQQQQVKQVLQQQQHKLNVQQNHQKESAQENQQKKNVRQNNRRKKNVQRCQQQKQQQRQPKKPRRSARTRKITPDPPLESAALPAPILSSSEAVNPSPVRAPTPTLSRPLPSIPAIPRAPIIDSPRLTPIDCDEYCGLKPSTTDFYPFITLPPEVTMKRCQKLFPLLNKLNTTSIMTLTGDSTLTTSVISGPLPRPSGSMAAHQMATARKVASQIRIKDLKKELVGALRMLTRQRCFLEQSVRNMDAWCKNNLDAHDLATVYHDNSNGGNNGVAAAGMMRDCDNKCGMRLPNHVTTMRVPSHFWSPQPPSTGSSGTVVGVL